MTWRGDNARDEYRQRLYRQVTTPWERAVPHIYSGFSLLLIATVATLLLWLFP